MKNGKPYIMIVCGSKSDMDLVEEAENVLKNFNVHYSIMISSAHRLPEKTTNLAKKAEEKGVDIIIAIAGLAAHLPGVIASHTTLPVIGVPKAVDSLGGMDALLSIVQMPKSIPVATMAIGKTGAYNAAIFALKIIAIRHGNLRNELKKFIKKLKDETLRKLSKHEKNPI